MYSRIFLPHQCRFFALVLATVAFPSFAQNLLRGDPDFETGLVAWQAVSAPWRTPYLATDFFEQRVAGLAQPGTSVASAWHGLRSLELNHPDDPRFRTYVVGAPIRLASSTAHTFSAMARCARPTKVQLRVIAEKNNRDPEAALVAATHDVGSEWTRLALTLPQGIEQRIFPAIDMRTPGRCWFDALSLVGGKQPPDRYAPPAPIAMAILPGGSGRPWTHNLFLTQESQATIDVNYELALFAYPNAPAQVSLSVELQSPDDGGPPRRLLDRQVLQLSAGNRLLLPLRFTLPGTGIWKLTATATDGNGQRWSAETAIATMRPHTGPRDAFFGTQQKWDPMVDVMGFGSIRDMRLLEWITLQPGPDRWTWPSAAETLQIRKFIADGGHYLATLVGESPTKHDYFAKTWGKTSYGQMPLWAGGSDETRSEDFKRIFRMPSEEAIRSYAGGIARAMPYLELEVMNEPLYYMRPEDYLFILRNAYEAIKKENPSAIVAAFANPPDWYYLPGGARSKWKGAAPYHWHEEAFTLGAAKYLDVVTLHTYDRTHKPEVPETGYGTGQAAWARGFQRFLRPEQEIWISEKGVASPSWLSAFDTDVDRGFHQKVDSALTQASWIVRSQLDALAHDVKRFYLWNRAWSQGSHERFLPDTDAGFTLFEPDGSPRPALIAQRVLMETLSGATHVKGGQTPAKVRYELFRRSQEMILAVWIPSERNARNSRRTVELTCSASAVTRVTRMYGSETGCDSVRISGDPVYLRTATEDAAEKTIARLGQAQ